MSESEPAWSWPEDRWRAAVNGIRAGRTLKPKKWKGGARAIMALSFNVANETIGFSGDASGPDALARGQYGARAGLPRILRLLKAHGAQATFFVPAVSAMLDPDGVKAIAGGGHEIGLCSWIGEATGRLGPDNARQLLAGARDVLERLCGAKPTGLRAPDGLSPDVVGILSEVGIRWDSSLSADDEPYELLANGASTGLVEIPVDAGRTDATYFGTGIPVAPEAVFDIFRRELEVAYEEGGLFQLTLHPHLLGRRSRIWILEELLRIARTLPGMKFATHGEVAGWCGARAST